MTPKRIKEINEGFYRIHKAIPLTKGMMTLIDDDDYEMLSKFKWHFVKVRGHTGGYAVWAKRENGKKVETVPMHKMILKYPDNLECDHIDGNGLNNHRSNLRICTHAENLRNQALSKANLLGFKGVSLHTCKKYYMARITINKVNIYLGKFNTVEEASAKRIQAEKELFGEFMRKSS